MFWFLGSGGLPPLGNLWEREMSFEEFWKTYPKKVAKAEARKAWTQTEKIRPPIEEVIKAVKAASQSEQWTKGSGAFIPHAATWLRGERWEDEHEVKLPDIVNDKPWHQTWTGIQQKGAELGIKEDSFATPVEFKTAVMRAAMRAA